MRYEGYAVRVCVSMGSFKGPSQKHLILKSTLPWLRDLAWVSRSMPALYKNKEHLCEVWEENGVGKVKGKKRRLSESAVYTYEYGHCCAMLWLGQDKLDVAAWLLARLFG